MVVVYLTIEYKSKTVSSNCSSSVSINKAVARIGAIPIIRNGHTSIVTSKNYKRTIVTYNTCGFDSLLSIYTCLYFDNPSFRGTFFGQSKFAAFVKAYFDSFNQKNDSKNFAKTEDLKKLYDERNVLLKEMFTLQFYSKSKNMKKNGDIIHIDCSTGIGGFFGQLCLEMCNNIGSSIETKTCGKCERTTGTVLPFISVFTIDLDLGNIQESIRLQSSKNRSCKYCKSKCVMKRVLNNLVALEVEPNIAVGLQKKISIEDISQTIEMGKNLQQFAIVEYDPSLRHFKSYIKRKNVEWLIYDDMQLSEIKAKETEEVLPYMLFYLKTEDDSEYQDTLHSLFRENRLTGRHLGRQLNQQQDQQAYKYFTNFILS